MDQSKLREQIRSDSPDLINVAIGSGGFPPGYVPDDGDWASLGRQIGLNTHLKEMTLNVRDEDFRHLDSVVDVGHFLRGVANNQSIENLRFGAIIGDGMVFDILTPFFKNNRKFECLSLDGFGNFTSLGLQRLARALGQFTRLKQFRFTGCGVLPGELFQALHGHTSLENLSFSSANIDRDGCAALSSLLQKTDSMIQLLKFFYATIADDGAEVLGRGLASSRSLKEISLRGIIGISGRGWQAIFTALRNPDENRLEELDLSHDILDRDLIPLLGTSLAQNSTLKTLKLNSILTIPSDWGALTTSISAILGNRNSTLERLDLTGNGFYEFNEKNEALISLAASLENNTSLKGLLLEDDYEDVDFGYEYEDEEDMPPVTPQAWNALSLVLCNTSSIMATFSSNHVLQVLELAGCVPREVASLLKLNKQSKSEAARFKIVNAHFSGDFDVRPFVEMEMKTLPHALAWMARGNTLNGMYQLVKYAIVKSILEEDTAE